MQPVFIGPSCPVNQTFHLFSPSLRYSASEASNFALGARLRAGIDRGQRKDGVRKSQPTRLGSRWQTQSFECAKGNVRDHDASVCPVGFVERRGCHAGVLGWISGAGRRRHVPCFSRPCDGMGTKGHLFVT